MLHFIVPHQNFNQNKENKMENTNLNKVVVALVAFTVAMIFGGILALPVMLLWNTFLVPALTVAKSVSWLQAWGILLLINLMQPTRIQN